MNELIIEEIKNYDFGFITLCELVERISTIDCKEGKIFTEQLAKIQETDAYQDALRRFRNQVEELFIGDRAIYSILSYYQLMTKSN